MPSQILSSLVRYALSLAGDARLVAFFDFFMESFMLILGTRMKVQVPQSCDCPDDSGHGGKLPKPSPGDARLEINGFVGRRALLAGEHFEC